MIYNQIVTWTALAILAVFLWKALNNQHGTILFFTFLLQHTAVIILDSSNTHILKQCIYYLAAITNLFENYVSNNQIIIITMKIIIMKMECSSALWVQVVTGVSLFMLLTLSLSLYLMMYLSLSYLHSWFNRRLLCNPWFLLRNSPFSTLINSSWPKNKFQIIF